MPWGIARQNRSTLKINLDIMNTKKSDCKRTFFTSVVLTMVPTLERKKFAKEFVRLVEGVEMELKENVRSIIYKLAIGLTLCRESRV